MLSRALGAFVRPARFSLAAASRVAAANLRVRATTFASLNFKHGPITLLPVPVRGFAAAAAPPTAVLLQLGSSSFRPIEGVLDKNITALFKALRADETFTTDLKLGDCIVEAVASARRKPAADAKWEPLEDIATLGELWEQLKQLESAGLYLHVRVRLPSAPAAAAAAAPALLREDATDEEVWAELAPAARTAVTAARAQRNSLAAVPALKELRAVLPAATARELGVTVLRKDQEGNMAVGMFDVPALNEDITKPPKTFDDITTSAQKLLLVPQRLQRAFELVDAVASGRHLGAHLSGPNGVGKSAVGLLAYLICTARGLPAAYIARSQDWVKAAREPGGGDAFLLKTFWRQNADLIVASPALRKVFLAALQGAESPFTASIMDQLSELAGSPALPGLAIITDEVQHITKAVKDASVRDPAPEVQRAGTYFATTWYDWTNTNSLKFQRLSIASSHAERDTKLPDGEAHRLRIMEPLADADRAALQEHPASPAYVEDAAARERVVFIAGNVLRKLVRAAELLPRGTQPTKADFKALWQHMWDIMAKDCQNWLDSIPESERTIAARAAMDLVSGKVEWGSAKILYDTGIVFRSVSSPFVQPVSAAAAAVILRVLAGHVATTRKPISSIPDGRERGFELERQVIARLDGFAYAHGVPCKLLDGKPAAALDLRCSYSLPFGELEEVVSREVPVLYRPRSGTYACDAILMPAADDSSGKITFIESSTSEPLGTKRVNKVLKWFEPEGVVTKLQAQAGPQRQVMVVLVYDDHLPERDALSDAALALSAGQLPPELPTAAAAAPDVTSSADAASSADAPDAASSAASAASAAVGSASTAAVALPPPAAAAPAPAAPPPKKRGRPPKQQKQHAAAPTTPATAATAAAAPPPPAAPRAPVGDVVRVVDRSSLIEPLALLM